MPELRVPVDGGVLWADDTGGGLGLPPLVLIDPGTGDSRSWDPLLPELARSFRVVRYDSRGWGRSPAPTSPYTHLGDLVAVLDHLCIERRRPPSDVARPGPGDRAHPPHPRALEVLGGSAEIVA